MEFGFGLILFIVIVLVVLGYLATRFSIVTQANRFIIERLGGYYQTWDVGLHFLVPFIDRVKSRVSIKEQVVDFDPQPVITKDNVTMQIDTVIFYQITDPKLYTYGVNEPIKAIDNLTSTTLRNIIGDLELDESLTSRDIINEKMRGILDEATDPWGIKINRVEVKNIIPPKDIREAMEKQMRAERDRRARILEAEGLKRAQILEAEGAKESDINRAEGQKQAEILRAEGSAQAKVRIAQAEAEAIEKIAQSIAKDNPVAATHYLIAQKYLETLQTMTEGDKAKTIYLPYEATGVLSSLGGIKDLLTNNQ